MDERKNTLIEQKNKIEARIKEDQGKLKIINQELNNIELKEKSNRLDELINGLKNQGIENVDKFLELVKDGKINIKE